MLKETDKACKVYTRLTDAGLFTRQFGTFTKADYEVLMFTAFLDIYENIPNDYEISIALGITESKVRSLRLKSQLLYPRDYAFLDNLKTAVANGYFDLENMTYTITIEDPAVQRRTIYEIEKNLGNVQFTLNPKHLKLPIETYILLGCSLLGHEEKDLLAEANRKWKEAQGVEQEITKENLKKRIWKNKSDFIEATSFLMQAASVGIPLIQQMLMNIRI